MTERPPRLDGRRVPTAPPEAGDAARREEISGLLRRLTLPPPKVSPGSAADDAGYVLTPEPPLGLLSAILARIDATVMPRCLVIRAQDGRCLRLDASNRRLLGYVVESPDHGVPSIAGTLTYAALDDLARLCAALEGICNAAPLHLKSAPPSGMVGMEQTGVSVPTLRNAIDLAADPSQTPRSGTPDSVAWLRAFAEETADMVDAWCIMNGPAQGAPSRIAGLEDALEDWLSGSLAPTVDPCGLVLAPDEGGGGAALLLAILGEEALAMAIAPGLADQIGASWLRFISDR